MQNTLKLIHWLDNFWMNFLFLQITTERWSGLSKLSWRTNGRPPAEDTNVHLPFQGSYSSVWLHTTNTGLDTINKRIMYSVVWSKKEVRKWCMSSQKITLEGLRCRIWSMIFAFFFSRNSAKIGEKELLVLHIDHRVSFIFCSVVFRFDRLACQKTSGGPSGDQYSDGAYFWNRPSFERGRRSKRTMEFDETFEIAIL